MRTRHSGSAMLPAGVTANPDRDCGSKSSICSWSSHQSRTSASTLSSVSEAGWGTRARFPSPWRQAGRLHSTGLSSLHAAFVPDHASSSPDCRCTTRRPGARNATVAQKIFSGRCHGRIFRKRIAKRRAVIFLIGAIRLSRTCQEPAARRSHCREGTFPSGGSPQASRHGGRVGRLGDPGGACRPILEAAGSRSVLHGGRNEPLD